MFDAAQGGRPRPAGLRASSATIPRRRTAKHACAARWRPVLSDRPPVGNLEAARVALRRLSGPRWSRSSRAAGTARPGAAPIPGASTARVEPSALESLRAAQPVLQDPLSDNWRVLEPPSGFGVTIVPPGCRRRRAAECPLWRDRQSRSVRGIDGRPGSRARRSGTGNDSILNQRPTTSSLLERSNSSEARQRIGCGPRRLARARFRSRWRPRRPGQEERVTRDARIEGRPRPLRDLHRARLDAAALAPAFRK